MKILIVTKNWLGDILFEIPAIQAIRENFPKAHLTALAPARCQEILQAVPYLDEVRVFDERSGEKSLPSKVHFMGWLRQQKFDQVFLFHRSFTRSLLTALGGIPQRVGYETSKRKWLLTRPVPLPSRPLHQVDFFLVLLKWAGLKVNFESECQFFYRPDDNAKAYALMEANGLREENFVAFHVGANWGPKRWPANHFAELAGRLQKNFSCPVVLTGSQSDERIATEIVKIYSQGNNLISLCGKTSLGVLGALYQKAAFVVSSDSGPLHIASGVGTPVVALFGPTCPRMTGPRGIGKKIVIQFVPEGYSVPWKGGNLPEGGWMEKISPEVVFQKIKDENLWPAKEKASLLLR